MMLRRRLAGLAALLLIIGIIVGIPAVLIAMGANPLADGLPSLNQLLTALTSPDDGRLALAAIKIVAALAWLIFTVSILIELASTVRGIRAPKLPGLRLPQNMANRLVSTATLLFVASPLGSVVAHADPIQPSPAPTVAATTEPKPAQAEPRQATPIHEHSGTSRAGDDERTKQTPPRTVDHTVKRGETLWSIAEHHLGDGQRYKEIVKLNKDLLDGKASFIKAGWTLKLPAPDQPTALTDTTPRTVTVKPGDTLSDIAEKHLGDPNRYPEIFKASRTVDQPGQTRLTNPNIIDVGWTVVLPDTDTPHPDRPRHDSEHRDSHRNDSDHAAGGAPRDDHPTTDRSDDQPADEESDNQPGSADAGVDGSSDDQRDAPPPPPASAPGQTVSAIPSAPQESAPQQAVPEGDDGLGEESRWMVRTGYGVGAILAAGVVTLLASRRRQQQRLRRPGQRLPDTEPATVRVEQDLRATADPISVETVDRALRSLARHCRDTKTPMPNVRAGRLTEDQFDLYLSEPARLPEPWTEAVDDHTVWTLTRDNTDGINHDTGTAVPAPYPALVTIGHDEDDGHVFLNLEQLGALAITGTPDQTREILAALAIELATSAWADDLQVTIVGAFPELEDILQTGRIRYLPSTGRLLEDLDQRAQQDRQALTDAATPDLHSARVTDAAPDAWQPEIVLLAGDITDRQRNLLQQLIDDVPRVAIAAITTGSTKVGAWSLNLPQNNTETAILEPIGLAIRPQHLPAEHYGHLLEVTALTDADELQPANTTEPAPEHDQRSATGPADAPEDATEPLARGVLLPAAERPDHSADDVPALNATQTPPHLPDTIDSGSVATEPAVLTDDQPAAMTDAHVPTDSDHGEGAPSSNPADEASSHQDQKISTEADEPVSPEDRGEAAVQPIPLPAPKVLVLGPVDMINADGKVEPNKRARLLEYATYLVLHPGASHTAIDDAIWPDRKTEDNFNTRNPATSKLRRWVGTDPEGNEYLPRHQAGEGYRFLPTVSSDANDWDTLLAGNPLQASTENLEAALALVRGIPFEGTHRRRYAWAEPIKQRLISEIVDASYELAKRRLMSGDWRAAEEAVVIGLRIEPAQESLWRLRILAAHESRNPVAEAEAIQRLLTITEQLECDLEPETEELLEQLKNPTVPRDHVLATAL